jgi:hypothetical protein
MATFNVTITAEPNGGYSGRMINYTGVKVTATYVARTGRVVYALGQNVNNAVRNLSRKTGIPVDSMQVTEAA